MPARRRELLERGININFSYINSFPMRNAWVALTKIATELSVHLNIYNSILS